jgi:HEAT repeat protein
MGLFPELESFGNDRLQESFLNGSERDCVQESELWLQEVAVRIAQTGDNGLEFLLRDVLSLDSLRLRAVLISLCFLPDAVRARNKARLEALLLSLLETTEDSVVAEAIEALRCLGNADVLDRIMPLLSHQSPYVVGSALRYVGRLYPSIAKPLVSDALGSRSAIVRQAAIDELDELGCADMIPAIRRLFDDDDKDVRAAARTAVKNLSM